MQGIYVILNFLVDISKKNKKEQLKLILFYLTIYSKYHSNM